MKPTEVTKTSPKAKANSEPKKDVVIRLVKLKQWYIPEKAADYKVLHALKVPLVRFHENFLPTLLELTKKRGFKVMEVPFRANILDPFLDKLGTTWQKQPYHECVIQSKRMVFKTTKAEIFEDTATRIPKLRDHLTEFFDRWGFKYRIDHTSPRSKHSYIVDYWFDSNKDPVIPLVEPEKQEKITKIKLGMVRLVFKQTPQYLDTILEISQGGVFKPYHSTRCPITQISDVRPLMKMMMEIVNNDIHNFDNPDA